MLRRFPYAISALLVGLSLSGLAFGDPLEDGLAAFRSRDYDTAIKALLPLAREGNVQAQVAVGTSHMLRAKYNDDLREAHKWLRPAAEQGFMIAQYELALLYTYEYYRDFPQAAKWFRLAAEQEYAPAQVALGRALSGPEMPGVPRNPVEAFQWQQRAANQGYVEAYLWLGWHYSHGSGVPKNLGEAVKWIRRAAEQGHFGAYLRLARMYEKGEGVSQDNVQAFMWYDLVAQLKGDKAAAIFRDTVASRMTQEQIAESRRLTREWLAKHHSKP